MSARVSGQSESLVTDISQSGLSLLLHICLTVTQHALIYISQQRLKNSGVCRSAESKVLILIPSFVLKDF